MSLSNVQVKIATPTTEKRCTGCARCSPDNCYDIAPRMSCLEGWRDSFIYRPSLQDEIWVCNGEGGEVTPSRYVGAGAGHFHGLFGITPELRDDHYYWQPRPPGRPPDTLMKPLPQVTFDPATMDRWTHSSDGLPSIGETVWIDDEVCGPQVARLDLISGTKPVFISVDGFYKYAGHRYWAMLMPPKRPV